MLFSTTDKLENILCVVELIKEIDGLGELGLEGCFFPEEIK